MPDAGSHQPASFSLLCPAKALVQRERKAHEFCYYNKYNNFNIELYSHKRAAKAVPKVVQLFLPVFYFYVSKCKLDIRFTGANTSFLDLENILFPEVSSESSTEGGPIVFSSRWWGTRYDSPKLIVGSECGTTPPS